ncbi:MAG: 16S rRNA (cytosine(1402)-N(4))-methyltransferase RsmH, partial [Bacteroidales bacterium]|nr:16S rRNA (cytosine(1402)-N(4))-methyltransferase RsmH [Bacteroidales bacterium]
RFDEGDLDMSMNQKASRKASDIVATYSKEELTRVFKNYGELPQAGRIAALLEKARATQSIQTIAEFKQVLAPIFSREKEKKDMAKVFQALRIEVNGEMQALEAMLQQALEMLAPGGRLSIISYHSLEDRLVKNFMRSGNFEGKVEQDFYGNRLSPFRLVNNKVIVPDKEEETNNPRSRSAKLRIAEKL